MKGDISALATGLIFLAIGIICLFWPEKIQQYFLDYYFQHRTFEKLNPFMNWMKTSSYIIALRIIGLIGMAGFIVILYVFIKN